jgi:hypothetical protein
MKGVAAAETFNLEISNNGVCENRRYLGLDRRKAMNIIEENINEMTK